MFIGVKKLTSNNRRNPIKSPVDDGIIPVVSTAILSCAAGVGLGWWVDINLLLSLVMGLSIWLIIFFVWMKIYLSLSELDIERVVRYEIQVVLVEERKTGYTERFPFILNLKPLQLYNVIIHLANGKGISHASLSQLGLTRNQITEIQEKFLEEGIIETRGITNTNGYDITPYGAKLIKTWATYPSPTQDLNGTFWKQV